MVSVRAAREGAAGLGRPTGRRFGVCGLRPAPRRTEGALVRAYRLAEPATPVPFEPVTRRTAGMGVRVAAAARPRSPMKVQTRPLPRPRKDARASAALDADGPEEDDANLLIGLTRTLSRRPLEVAGVG